MAVGDYLGSYDVADPRSQARAPAGPVLHARLVRIRGTLRRDHVGPYRLLRGLWAQTSSSSTNRRPLIRLRLSARLPTTPRPTDTRRPHYGHARAPGGRIQHTYILSYSLSIRFRQGGRVGRKGSGARPTRGGGTCARASSSLGGEQKNRARLAAALDACAPLKLTMQWLAPHKILEKRRSPRLFHCWNETPSTLLHTKMSLRGHVPTHTTHTHVYVSTHFTHKQRTSTH